MQIYSVIFKLQFFNYNFSTSSKTVPYLAGQLYQKKFDLEENEEFSDYSYANIGFGVKNFFNEYAALNMSANYGFSLAEVEEGQDKQGMILLLVGLSFIF